VTRIPAPQALAVRRVVVVALAFAATLAAHAQAAGGLMVRPAAPLLWLGLLCLAALAGPRRGWRPRGPARTFALTALLQAATHAAMTAAPWAVGLDPHHGGHAVVGIGQVAPHLGAALLIALVVTRLERWLGRAADLVRRVRRWFAAAPRPARPRVPLAASAVRVRPGRVAGPRTSRGPPPLRTA
jgi:hypothetical protein